jgi:hypothetical protein
MPSSIISFPGGLSLRKFDFYIRTKISNDNICCGTVSYSTTDQEWFNVYYVAKDSPECITQKCLMG